MAKGKKVPERSKLERAKPLPYLRTASDQPLSSDATAMSDPKKSETKADAKAEAKPADATPKADKPEERTTGKMAAIAVEDAAPAIPPSELTTATMSAVALADAAPAVPAARHARETIAMPIESTLGAPPAVPSSVEDPTFMPGPNQVPAGAPTDPAQAPGRVPAGDSRSFRRGSDFALVYRQGTAVISRFGTVGTRGQWRVVEYPTSSSASNAYAKECSRFVGEGFSDYRD